MTWDQIRRIRSVAALPFDHKSCEFRIVPGSDCVPLITPGTVNLGEMSGAYRTVDLRLSNPGPSSVSILDALSSHPTRAMWLKVPHSKEILDAGSEVKVAILVRSAGLTAGKYVTQLLLTFRCKGLKGVENIDISFTVPRCDRFTLDAYPRAVYLHAQKESKLVVECCNYSDRPGTVAIGYENFSKSVPGKRLVLYARQALLHELTVSPEMFAVGHSRPAIILSDLDTATYIAVPVLAAVEP